MCCVSRVLRQEPKGIVLFISTPGELAAFCERAASSNVLAIDTEFLRERTYRPRLCLLQLATSANDTAAVDPLALQNLSPVACLFTNPAITKVLHACSQDLEVIDGELGCVPSPIFDTQVAAAFLGQRMQLGYGALVEAYTGVHLAKTESLTDWSRRPLDPEQLSYAEDDVRYLPDIYEKMCHELVRRDRLSWVLPEMQELLNPAHYRHEPLDAYHHLKRVGSLTRKQLAVAREVCAWRERAAAQRNIPRKWVMSDEIVLEICRRMPATDERLHHIRGTEQMSDSDSNALLHAVLKGLAYPAAELPHITRHTRPTADQECVLDLMYAMLRIISEKSGVAAQLIATRDDLLDFLSGHEHSALMQGWRHELAGGPLTNLLNGSCGLTIKDGHVEIL